MLATALIWAVCLWTGFCLGFLVFEQCERDEIRRDGDRLLLILWSGKSFRALTGRLDITVGMAACVQTFGNFANFHPHLHILVTDGGFTPNGTFYVLPKVSLTGLERLFRHTVLKMMLPRRCRKGPAV